MKRDCLSRRRRRRPSDNRSSHSARFNKKLRATDAKRSQAGGALSDSISIIHFACAPCEWRGRFGRLRNAAFQD